MQKLQNFAHQTPYTTVKFLILMCTYALLHGDFGKEAIYILALYRIRFYCLVHFFMYTTYTQPFLYM